MNKKPDIRELLNQKAMLSSRLKLLPYDGSPEIKTQGSKKYLYVRKRIGSKNTSKYVDVYSDELYQLLLRTNKERRTIEKQIRVVIRQLGQLGYTESDLTPDILHNIDLAHSNIKNAIYSQAVLEGIGTTFPQTEEIIENGKVNNVSSKDVQKILNLKHAWEFILDEDVLSCPTDFSILSEIAKTVNQGFLYNGGMPRTLPVSIGGSTYKPPIPDKDKIITEIFDIVSSKEPIVDRAVRLCLYCMKAQIFQDGNKRASVIFANHFLVANAGGLLLIAEENVANFKNYLIQYYEDSTDNAYNFVKKNCVITFK